jgi:nicotinate-nucleotide adenylyltransferase
VKAKAPREGVSRETPPTVSPETYTAPHEDNAIAEGARDIFISPRSSSHVRLPPHAPGLRVGLFGGSFNPPHEGHRAASLLALRQLRLDCIWWLVSPGNPLKDKAELAPLAARMSAAQKLASHPRIKISGIEEAIGTTYSFETIAWLKRRCPGVHFVWIMGADNLAGLHRWKRWRDLVSLVPIAVIDRPGSTLKSMSSRGAGALAPYRLSESAVATLATATPPAFAFLHGPRSSLSSTALRARRT